MQVFYWKFPICKYDRIRPVTIAFFKVNSSNHHKKRKAYTLPKGRKQGSISFIG